MTSSKPVSKEHFLNASLELQMDFVKMWCEGHRTSIEKQLEDAQCIQMIYFDLNEQFENFVFGLPVPSSQKEKIFEGLRDEMLHNFTVAEAQRFFINMNGHTFSVVFYGAEHPVHSSEKTFLGLFEDDSTAIKAMQKLAYTEEPFF